MKRFCLEVSGDFACFTRPEMKVERVSYDLITPSAARAIFESILFKKENYGRPALQWHIRKVEVLNPIRWINLRRNEVGTVLSIAKVKTAMKNGGRLGMNVEDERQQRAGLFLRDVRYRIHADMEVFIEPAQKYFAMFERRASKGQCFNQPYLGCREFSADFRLVDPKEQVEAIEQDQLLGWMLYDLDYSDPISPMPRFFDAKMKSGVVKIPEWNSEEVRG
jgi:CRISPR-associated protein Cas5d